MEANMKVKLYFDVWPGMDPKHIHATATPGSRMANGTRYAFTLEIPDPNNPDEILPTPTIQEVPR